MPNLVDVRFLNYRRTYRFNAGDLEVTKGSLLIVERDGTLEAGTAEYETITADEDEICRKMPKVIRVANDNDRARLKKMEERSKEAYCMCHERIKDRGLSMKLVRASMLFDGSKAIFYFTADGRVDFRELVKDLAYKLRVRIEMMQVGVRDEAKMLGGQGVCGRPLCCSTWIDNFSPVSIRMAKDQNLSLNPTKVSGVCGRLMCCLVYEHGHYREMGRGLPKLGKRVMTPQGRGRVSRLDILSRRVYVYLEEGREVEVKSEELSAPSAPPKES